MKVLLKSIIKVFLSKRFLLCIREYSPNKTKLYNSNIINKISFLFHNRFVVADKYDFMSTAIQESQVLSKIRFKYDGKYIYPLDIHLIRTAKNKIASLTPDYSRVLNSSINDIKEELSGNTFFTQGMNLFINSIISLINRIIKYLEYNNNIPYKERNTQLISYFSNMINDKAKSFDEALQRILFYNALLWQNKHMHNGLGRLDKILYPFYKNDLENGIATKDQMKKQLKEFILIIGKDTYFKSATLIGDTGQVIILGGKTKEENNIENDLTSLILELMAELAIPDPKLILRVNKNTSTNIWNKAVKCMMTGCGSPLIMNEERIMPMMESFGYKKEDCFELGTSACWEPLIIGKSFDQNNPVPSIILLQSLNDILMSVNEYNSFNDLFIDYNENLLKSITSKTINIEFDKSPILSLLFDNCLKRGKDISEGGADYYFHGMQALGLPNIVNSLLNIKKYVFDDRLISLNKCKDAIRMNYKGMDDIRSLFQNNTVKFGKKDEEVLKITNKIINTVSNAIAKIRINGNKVKVGFSSPSYLSEAINFNASIDGRSYGEPFSVHISPQSKDIDISEILDFASSLNYPSNCINGNVVDFTIPSAFKNYPDKFVSVLKYACIQGIFELQLNVLNKKQLIDAKAHPEKYPNLVVRVWGFSAYFNNLPEEYKDNLIRRAEIYAE